MPYTFFGKDSRATGTGSPALDADNIEDILAGMGGSLNVQNTAFAGGADPTGVQDSSAAFAAGIAAAVTARGQLFVPPGTYTCNVPSGVIPITGPFTMTGLGAALAAQTITPNPGVVINCNGGGAGTTSLFTFPNQGYLWGGLVIESIAINYTGTGNVFNQCSFMDSVFRDVQISLTAAGSMAFQASGAGSSYFNILHERVNIYTTAPVRTNPMVSITNPGGGAISDTTWFRCKFFNNGLDTTQFMVVYACTGSGLAYHYADNFIECWFEHAWGGAYQSLSGQGIKVDGCTVWDISSPAASATVAAASNGGTIANIAAWANPAPGVLAATGITSNFGPAGGTLSVAASGPTTAIITYTGHTATTFTGCAYVSGSPAGTVSTGGSVTEPLTVGNSSYYFGAYPGNSGSQGVRVTGCTRNLTGPNGTTAWDIECESTTSQVQVEGFTTKATSPTIATNAFFNFHGCNDVVLLNNVSPQGASVNGNSTTVITNPSPTQFQVSQGVVTPGPPLWLPSDNGLLAAASDPYLATGSLITTAGTVYLMKFVPKQVTTITNIWLGLIVLGSGASTGSFVGVYNSAGTLLTSSSDVASSLTTTAGAISMPVTTPQTVSPGSFVWLAFVFNLAVTQPTLAKGVGGTGGPGFVNAGLTAAAYRYATNGTVQTALPSPSVNPNANTATSSDFWWGIS